MDVSYWKFYQAYVNTFARMGLPAISVEADGGAIGDLDNHEFMTLSDAGEDTVLRCPNCGYAANVERCAVVAPAPLDPATFREKPIEIVSTPGARTIREVAGLLGTAESNLVKTLIYVADGAPIAVLLRGDRSLNEIKLKRLVGAATLAPADDMTVERVTTAPVGFAGPVGLNEVRIIADNAVAAMGNFITGANQADAHFVHVNVERDFTPSEFADIAEAIAGDLCPNCQIGLLEDARGIEVGHIFKLGTKYSGPMAANYSSEDGTLKPILMGSYGIGLTRLLAALVETSHDENGIIWHPAVAPFHVAIIVGNYKDAEMNAAAQTLHDALIARGIEVMFDDRDERPGPKFKDADLVGYPVRVVVGKGLAAGNIEIRSRKDAASGRDVPVAEAADAVATLLRALSAPATAEP
jgi:prolyl-tRNA synthetase